MSVLFKISNRYNQISVWTFHITSNIKKNKMKKLLLLFAASFILVSLQAQEKEKFRGGLDFGYCSPKGGGGLGINFNLAYNLADNMNIGIRYGSAALAKEVNGTNASLTTNASYLGTFNYYFNHGGSSFAPFVGAGVGYYALGNLTINDASTGGSISGKAGGLLSTGFELGKFRLGLEYNLIPSTKIEGISTANLTIASSTVNNSYFAVTLGFYLGGGKWKK